jgi:hypothetical protein
MPILPYLEGRAFDSEMIRIMGGAFENVARELGLADKNDRLAKIVARTVIDMAERGFHEPQALTAAVLKEFQPRSQAKDARADSDAVQGASAA